MADRAFTFSRHLKLTKTKSIAGRSRLTIITTVIFPILTYASLAWGYACLIQPREAQGQTILSFKVAQDVLWHLSNETSFTNMMHTPITQKIQERARETFEPLKNLPNAKLRQLLQNEHEWILRYQKPINQLVTPKITVLEKHKIIYIYIAKKGFLF